MPWMYILQCADGSYYVGATTDLERRVREHNQGKGARYTKGRQPVKLVYAVEFASFSEAYRWERKVHRWGRAKREALIRGEITLTPESVLKKGANEHPE